jgi:hypothetical protein
MSLGSNLIYNIEGHTSLNNAYEHYNWVQYLQSYFFTITVNTQLFIVYQGVH